MDTDSFTMYLRRFIRCSGNVRMLRSDNINNFIGAGKELKGFLKMGHKQIRVYLQNLDSGWVIWEKNQPGGSHFGGILEGQVRSARAGVASLLKTHGSSLNDEAVNTLLKEVVATVNSRPVIV